MYAGGDSDTIISISTSTASNAAIGVIRLSGFANFNEIQPFFVVNLADLVANKTKRTGIFFNNIFYDDVLVTFFKSPASYTGENVLEIACHGNVLILRNIIDLFLKHTSIRQAKAGEFTLRALQNKKLSLSQVEGLDLLLNANNSIMINAGHSIMSGVLHDQYRKLHHAYLALKSHLELGFDFLEDVGEDFFSTNLLINFNKLKDIIFDLYKNSQFSIDQINKLSIVLFGKPNAGKSTVFNKILGRDRSIVSDVAGTTRDYISESILIDNNYFELIDTAGIHESDDLIELKGIERSKQLIDGAFFKVLVVHALDLDISKFMDFDYIIITHCDLLSGPIEPVFYKEYIGKIDFIDINTKLIADSLHHSLLNKLSLLKHDSLIPIERHRNVISVIYSFIPELTCLIQSNDDLAIISHELNSIGHLIEELVGIVSPDDVLNNIFDNFCIGK
jgi:tRNA modification GTPase